MQGQQPIVPTQKVPFWAIHNALRETALTRPELKAKQSEILFLIEGLTVYSFPQTRSLIKDLFGPELYQYASQQAAKYSAEKTPTQVTGQASGQIPSRPQIPIPGSHQHSTSASTAAAVAAAQRRIPTPMNIPGSIPGTAITPSNVMPPHLAAAVQNRGMFNNMRPPMGHGLGVGGTRMGGHLSGSSNAPPPMVARGCPPKELLKENPSFPSVCLAVEDSSVPPSDAAEEALRISGAEGLRESSMLSSNARMSLQSLDSFDVDQRKLFFWRSINDKLVATRMASLTDSLFGKTLHVNKGGLDGTELFTLKGLNNMTVTRGQALSVKVKVLDVRYTAVNGLCLAAEERLRDICSALVETMLARRPSAQKSNEGDENEIEQISAKRRKLAICINSTNPGSLKAQKQVNAILTWEARRKPTGKLLAEALKEGRISGPQWWVKQSISRALYADRSVREKKGEIKIQINQNGDESKIEELKEDCVKEYCNKIINQTLQEVMKSNMATV